jgi:CHAD domain-containing protein
MAIVASIPTAVASKPAGLEEWMNRAVERAAKAQDGFDIDDVHNLRVALRRCRTMADALSEVNPNAGWRKLKKASAPMFHALGELRDVQVTSALVQRLGLARDPVRRHMLRLLSAKERACRANAAKALDDFDRKEWKKLARKLGPKARFFPIESVVFQRLALARLNAAVELYQQARRKRSSTAWHRLRIGMKRFRYVVDNFLPRRYEVWVDDLKRIQDSLGELHDLDVLRAVIRREASRFDAAILSAWYKKIDEERKSHLAAVNAKLSGSQSLWLSWRAGLPLGHSLAVVPAAQRQRRSA